MEHAVDDLVDGLDPTKPLGTAAPVFERRCAWRRWKPRGRRYKGAQQCRVWKRHAGVFKAARPAWSVSVKFPPRGRYDVVRGG